MEERLYQPHIYSGPLEGLLGLLPPNDHDIETVWSRYILEPDRNVSSSNAHSSIRSAKYSVLYWSKTVYVTTPSEQPVFVPHIYDTRVHMFHTPVEQSC